MVKHSTVACASKIFLRKRLRVVAVELLTWRAILCTRSTLTACMSYVLTACIYIIYDEMFPVFGKTSVAQGGLGFSATDIGSALSVGVSSQASAVLVDLWVYFV